MVSIVSYIPQSYMPSFDFFVIDVVLMGLYSNSQNEFYNKKSFLKKFLMF